MTGRVGRGPPWAAALTRAGGGPPWALLVLLAWGCAAAPAPAQPLDVFNITRVAGGDKFSFKGSECARRECGGRSENLDCACACPAHHPLFREDTQQCVNDVTECSVAPFGTGSSAQRIPFVFLPLKGQIIHPSKEISFPGVRTPICAVSGAQFLTRNGFVDLRSTVDADVPFSLFRDEGRTFLQWTGEPEMRQRMEGRLLVVQLLCRDVAAAAAAAGGGGGVPPSLLGVFTPCAAFRVAGSPVRHVTNVSEVLFSPNARSSEESSSPGLSLNEYIAIGVSSVLLGLIYVASVFLYLHIKKRRAKSVSQSSEDVAKTAKANRQLSKKREKQQQKNSERERRVSTLSNNENIIVKNNPLLGIGRHFHERDKMERDFPSDSEGCLTETEDNVDDDLNEEDVDAEPHQVTSVTVHPMIHNEGRKIYESYYKSDFLQQREESSYERLPEENVSIVETFDFRDEKPESVPIGNTRKKLYFNPAYFEPHLLMAPPPAAIEFLIKIREVISIAKHKMASRRFTPSLGGIPEEDSFRSYDAALDLYHKGSQRSSVVSLKRENIRRRPYCSGCPGCNKTNMHNLSAFVPELSNAGVCHNCASVSGLNKQVSIRKWLEGVPILKSSTIYSSNSDSDSTPEAHSPGAAGLLNSLLSLPKDNSEITRKYYDFTSRSLYAEDTTNNFLFKKKISDSSVRSEPAIRTFNIPLPSIPQNISAPFKEYEKTVAKIKDISSIGISAPDHLRNKELRLNSPKQNHNHRMPDMINEALAMDKNKNTLDKKHPKPKHQYEAVEVVSITKNKIFDNNSNKKILEKQNSPVDYEADSLERSYLNRGLSTPTEYADISSSQASPSLSTALPMDEEMTMRNAIYKLNSGSRPSSRISNSNNKTDNSSKANGFYEPVETMNDKYTGNAFDNHIYSFPDLPHDNKPDYSLVSEVYVNNGYNFGSSPTSPSESDCSTFGKRKVIVRYDEPDKKPGQLTIELKDSPEHYVKIHESDGFEPDTLDRKPNKIKINLSNSADNGFLSNQITERNIMDIRTTGLFKSSSLSCSNPVGEAFQKKKSFGSLKQIYEAKNYETKNSKPSLNSIQFSTPKEAVDSQDYEIIENRNMHVDSDEGRILTLETRHCKRQRQSTPPSLKGTNKAIPPDVIPFEEIVPIYEYPKPPRKVETEILAPPLPPKNENGRSPCSRRKFSKVIAIVERDEREPSPSTLSSGPGSPSGASVRSVHSSDYENILPVNNLLLKSPRNNCYQINQSDAKDEPKNSDIKSITSSPSKSSIKPGFKEFQTPKPGRKVKQINSPRKLIKTKPDTVKKSWRRFGNQHKEDSGYLSTDSNDSRKIIKRKLREAKISGSETDESNEDARSESGAESIETHSVFFGSFRKMSLIANSMDSGMGSNDRLRSLISPFTESQSSQVSDCDDTAINILKSDVGNGTTDIVLY